VAKKAMAATSAVDAAAHGFEVMGPAPEQKRRGRFEALRQAEGPDCDNLNAIVNK